jgi:hypothetical protein
VLNNLNSIDWAKLGHAYGNATNVPAMIRNLLSESPEIRNQAYDDLFANIIHQGTPYTSTPIAFPFLMELLHSSQTPDRTTLAQLIGCIIETGGEGRYYWREIAAQGSQPTQESEQFWGVRTAEQKAEDARGFQVFLQVFEDLYEVIYSYLGDYFVLFEQTDFDTQSHILSFFDHLESNERIEVFLLSQAEKQTNPILAAMVLNSIGKRCESSKNPNREGQLIYLKDKLKLPLPEPMRFACALNIARIGTEEDTIAVLPDINKTIYTMFDFPEHSPIRYEGIGIVTKALENNKQQQLMWLEELLQLKHQEVREKSIWCLVHTDFPESLTNLLSEIIFQHLEDENPNVTLGAFRALDKLPLEKVKIITEVLFRALQNPVLEDIALRYLARKLREPRVLDYLFQKLEKSNTLHDGLSELEFFGDLAAPAIPKLKQLWNNMLNFAPQDSVIEPNVWSLVHQRHIVQVLQVVGVAALQMLPELHDSILKVWVDQQMSDNFKFYQLNPVLIAIGKLGTDAKSVAPDLRTLLHDLEVKPLEEPLSDWLKTTILQTLIYIDPD